VRHGLLDVHSLPARMAHTVGERASDWAWR
jgi:hypothetical protein